MRVRLVGALMAIAALALAAATSNAESGDKATGGGQVLFSSDGGAGNTIAFTAQKTAEGGKGQVQYINREAGFGRDQVRFHGTVECIEAEENIAAIAGTGRYGDGSTAPFQLYVQDNGEPNQGNDIVYLVEDAPDATCDTDDFEDPGDASLARGNAQVTDGD